MEKWEEFFAESAARRSADVAHDLKTPLNVSVLNLELLRMRVTKLLEGNEDEKTNRYVRSVEMELRRMAKIFDAYFVYSVPPRGGEAPELLRIDLALAEALRDSAIEPGENLHPGTLLVHPRRLDELMTLLITGVLKIIDRSNLVVETNTGNRSYRVSLRGTVSGEDADLGKIFKFYYTDGSGAPELALATARLIAETYGGSLDARQHDGSAIVELTLPISGDE
jgi:signal transduction histidine kinase